MPHEIHWINPSVSHLFFLRSSHLLQEDSWNKWTELETSGVTSPCWQEVFSGLKEETTVQDSETEMNCCTKLLRFVFCKFPNFLVAQREHKSSDGPHRLFQWAGSHRCVVLSGFSATFPCLPALLSARRFSSLSSAYQALDRCVHMCSQAAYRRDEHHLCFSMHTLLLWVIQQW